MLTGATGFIGRNILPLLRERYTVAAPGRADLDLRDAEAVRRFLEKGKFDAVVHAANPTGANPFDAGERLFEHSLRVFASLEHCAGLYGKMLYFGSGAEYGKHRALDMIAEDRIGEELPRDAYGLSRYLMQRLAARRDNIVNLRLFGCYGPGDPDYKLIPGIMHQVRAGREIRLRHNVRFDFLYVDDIVPVLEYCLENRPTCRDYNLCGSRPVTLLSVAEAVRRQMKSAAPIIVGTEGDGLAYTGSNERLRREIPLWKPRSMDEGIDNILTAEQRG